MKDIELPRKVLVGDNAIYEICELAKSIGLSGTPLVLCDEITVEVAGQTVADELGASPTVSETSSKTEVGEIKEKTGGGGVSYVVGVGGGRILDTGKIIAFEEKLPYISVPTSASHDGIASPQASLKQDKPVSVKVHSPLGVLCDTRIIAKAPWRLLASGCADAISNYTAVLDWRLAHQEKGDYFGDYAAELARMSAEIVMDNAEKIRQDISILVEALISSGVAIGIAGSSRPCSGAEHLFSHTLDTILEKPALHGEQCGIGSILTARLHDADWQAVRDALGKCGAPTTAEDAGIPAEKVVEALSKAHDIRDRHTILAGGISVEKSRQVAVETGVID